jgi:hypothetical protein
MKAATKGMAKYRGMNVTLASLSFQPSDLCNIKGLIAVVDTQHDTEHEGSCSQSDHDCSENQGLGNGINELVGHIDLRYDRRKHAATKTDQGEEEIYCVFDKGKPDHDLDQVPLGDNRV